jgi:hypothetical protein
VKEEKFIDENKHVAIIYNITDIGEYIIEMFYKNAS